MTLSKARFDVVSHLPALRRYARSLLRGEANAEDLVHETLVRAYEKRASFQEGRSLKPWLLSVMHNVFVDGQRAHQAEARRIERAADLSAPFEPPVQEHHVRLTQVYNALMQLPEDQRAALHLVAIEELTFADAAGVLGIPLGTLMSRLARARAALRDLESPANGSSAGSNKRAHLKIVGGSDGTSH
ncbi:sigma-70 family RNA polymerase sigma factor [Steroidobacter sp.]|uniref:sigma-70 family RNA polymerase sigma factor n=1 Tax=Steroidobacter sp. TaxID=1978227 RepID=UPI001A4C5DB0|nr:sigma-70 family RNA polymerase sigma factor [Steroidobacter sp.]MBL8271133.1 sigma-70 family RNA polymerase sigma factor [Steroidobacter sp.]